MSDSIVTRNEIVSRFEIAVGGHIAVLMYRLEPGSIVFVHTEVPEELEGQGLGKKLAIAALNYAVENSLKVVPLCPFVAGYIKRHPEYQDLVREDYRAYLTR